MEGGENNMDPLIVASIINAIASIVVAIIDKKK